MKRLYICERGWGHVGIVRDVGSSWAFSVRSATFHTVPIMPLASARHFNNFNPVSNFHPPWPLYKSPKEGDSVLSSHSPPSYDLVRPILTSSFSIPKKLGHIEMTFIAGLSLEL